MKTINTIYWISTILFAGFMLFSAIPNIMVTQETKDIFKLLGYPEYLIPFLGVAKALGAIALVFPGVPRLKEWAYAGLAFDVIGAFYSSIMAAGGFMLPMLMFVAILIVEAVSYIYYHKRLRARALRPVL